MVIPLDQTYFGVYSMKKLFQNYERFNAKGAKFVASDFYEHPCMLFEVNCHFTKIPCFREHNF